MTAMTADLNDLLAKAEADLADPFRLIDIAEEEIAAAIERHPYAADDLWHSFKLVQGTHELMSTEFVYRGHVRELLERVAKGEDTRPGTAAEVCLAFRGANLLAPLNSTGAGLYARMWTLAFPDHPVWEGQTGHYEALYADRIDDGEREVRGKLTRPDRHLSGVTCEGKHHGADVDCKYAPQAKGVLF